MSLLWSQLRIVRQEEKRVLDPQAIQQSPFFIFFAKNCSLQNKLSSF